MVAFRGYPIWNTQCLSALYCWYYFWSQDQNTYQFFHWKTTSAFQLISHAWENTLKLCVVFLFLWNVSPNLKTIIYSRMIILWFFFNSLTPYAFINQHSIVRNIYLSTLLSTFYFIQKITICYWSYFIWFSNLVSRNFCNLYSGTPSFFNSS
jgi:hypothetical protein